jgi:hypothetical protein
MIMDKSKLQALIATLPDNSDIVVCDGIDTFELYEDSIQIYPAIKDYTTVIIFTMGQQVDLQFDLDNREASKSI